MASVSWRAGFVKGSPSIPRSLAGLGHVEGGALAVLAPSAKGSPMEVTPQAGAARVFQRALRIGRQQGALQGRILHGTGRIPAGKPMVVVAAVAPSRSDALVAVESMLNALKGVATRRDV